MKKRKIAGALLALALLAGLCITGCGSSAGDDKGDVRTGTNAEVQTDEADSGVSDTTDVRRDCWECPGFIRGRRLVK